MYVPKCSLLSAISLTMCCLCVRRRVETHRRFPLSGRSPATAALRVSIYYNLWKRQRCTVHPSVKYIVATLPTHIRQNALRCISCLCSTCIPVLLNSNTREVAQYMYVHTSAVDLFVYVSVVWLRRRGRAEPAGQAEATATGGEQARRDGPALRAEGTGSLRSTPLPASRPCQVSTSQLVSTDTGK